MLVKEGAGRERGKNSHPCRVTRRRGMAVRRLRAASPRSQRAATRRGDGTRGNAPPPSSKFNSRRIIRTGTNKRTRERGATEDNS